MKSINPFYLISNVIYTDAKKHYVFIEKRCWNTMISVLFPKVRPSKTELRRLKNLCYDVYVEWMEKERVDYVAYNQKLNFLSDILNTEENLEEKQTPDTRIGFPEDVINDYTVESPIVIKDSDMKPIEVDENQNSTLLISLKYKDTFFADLTSFLNLYKIKGVLNEGLISHLSFGYCRTLVSTFISRGEKMCGDDYEYIFLKSISPFLLKYLRKFGCKNQFIFTCDFCKSLNTHKRPDRNMSNHDLISAHRPEHVKLVGYDSFSNFLTVNYNSIVLDLTSLDIRFLYFPFYRYKASKSTFKTEYKSEDLVDIYRFNITFDYRFFGHMLEDCLNISKTLKIISDNHLHVINNLNSYSLSLQYEFYVNLLEHYGLNLHNDFNYMYYANLLPEDICIHCYRFKMIEAKESENFKLGSGLKPERVNV